VSCGSDWMRRLIAIGTIALLSACLAACGTQSKVVEKPSIVEVAKPIPILPPDALLQDCEAPALPTNPPTYADVLRLFQEQIAALAQCQERIEALKQWRADVEPNPD